MPRGIIPKCWEWSSEKKKYWKRLSLIFQQPPTVAGLKLFIFYFILLSSLSLMEHMKMDENINVYRFLYILGGIYTTFFFLYIKLCVLSGAWNACANFKGPPIKIKIGAFYQVQYSGKLYSSISVQVNWQIVCRISV